MAAYLLVTLACAGLVAALLLTLSPKPASPVMVSLIIERTDCGHGGYDEAGLLALLRARGTLRALPGDDGDLPWLLPILMRDKGAATARDVVMGTFELHPVQGRKIELDVAAVERASGCKVSDLQRYPMGRTKDPHLDVRLTTGMLLASVGAAFLFWRLRGRSQMPLTPSMPQGHAIAAGLAGGVALQGINWLLSLALVSLGLSLTPSNVAPLATLLAAMPVVAGFFIVLAVPFAEELAFRHVMLRRFALAGRSGTGLLLTAGLFAAAHEIVPGEQSVLAWLATAALYSVHGLGLGWVYLRTGRLAASVAAHVAMNAIGLAMLAYSTS